MNRDRVGNKHWIEVLDVIYVIWAYRKQLTSNVDLKSKLSTAKFGEMEIEENKFDSQYLMMESFMYVIHRNVFV